MAAATSAPQMAVVENMLQRIAGQKGVLGLLVISPKDGSVWKTCISESSTFDEKALGLHAEKLHAFVGLTRSITRTIDVGNDLVFLRLRSRKYEFIVSPEKEYVLIVIQDYHVGAPDIGERLAAEAPAKKGGAASKEPDPLPDTAL